MGILFPYTLLTTSKGRGLGFRVWVSAFGMGLRFRAKIWGLGL